ncbi:uncharacterized protein LOC134273290 [Saccostrea cucullata]|uniref:uncharacterized protein LOC134273290 n=1 Tax=Saccostrea cuccullata TaxID=36930 RepID=UPI002ED529FA
MPKLSLLIFFILPGIVLCVSSSCKQGGNCVLPGCYCSTFKHEMDTTKIPQIVYFGFDDALTTVLPAYYDRLFNHTSRRNPNGCPIGMTLYVSHTYTQYPLVKRYYKEGHEIAVHSVTHTHIKTRADLQREADKQKRNIAKFADIPLDDIIGWRSPFLETAGDEQAEVLKGLGYRYDISLTYKRSKMSGQSPFPFTLDYGWTFYCQIKPCPTRSHRGFWEFPVNSLMDYKDQYPCGYVDGCYNAPKTEEEAYQYLFKNFKSSYEGNRAPFGLHMHAGWFYTQFHLDAMDRFINDILKNEDVYIVPVRQALEWMEHPTPMNELDTLGTWSCQNPKIRPSAHHSQQQQRPMAPVPQRPKSSKTTTTSTTTTTTTTTTPKPSTTTIKMPVWKPTPPKTTRKPAWAPPPPPKRLPSPPKKNFWSWVQPTKKFEPSTTSTLPPTTTISTTPVPTTISIPKRPANPGGPFVLTSNSLNPENMRENFANNHNMMQALETFSSTPRVIAEGFIEITPRPDLDNNAPTTFQPLGDGCIQGANCQLPSCLCKGKTPPEHMAWTDTPQFVYLTFDGPIQERIYQKYYQIIGNSRKNPNNCPVVSTFFVSQSGSSNNLIKRLYDRSNEIALKGYGGMPTTNMSIFEEGMIAQISVLQRMGIDIIQGWRSPNLKPLGDEQFRILRDYQYVYDATLTTQYQKGPRYWPYTLDFNNGDECVIKKCPKESYSGLWEVPTSPVLDYLGLYPCNFVDGCTNSPTTANDTFNFLWKEFTQHYTTNKAPLGLHFRHIWFTHPFFNDNLVGLQKFLDKVGEYKDVYFVTIRNLIEWMRHPTTVDQLNKGHLWQC